MNYPNLKKYLKHLKSKSCAELLACTECTGNGGIKTWTYSISGEEFSQKLNQTTT